MSLVVEQGYNLQIAIGGIVIGCAQTVSFGRQAEVKDATCSASQGTKQSILGQKSYTMSADGLQRVATGADVATNVTLVTLETAFEAKTLLDFEFGTDTIGANKTAGTAYIQSLTKTGGAKDEAKFSVTFEVTGPVTDTLNV